MYVGTWFYISKSYSDVYYFAKLFNIKKSQLLMIFTFIQNKLDISFNTNDFNFDYQ